MSLGDADITVLIIPVEECIPTVSGPVVVEEELCVHIKKFGLDPELQALHHFSTRNIS